MAGRIGFHFGPYPLKIAEAFVLTPLSIALVNLKPLVPGHVLVIPRRVVPRFEDLTSEEVTDLWGTAHRIAPILRSHYGSDALTFAIQDGPEAGQTVPHTHIHVLPRKGGDFERNDEVYEKLEKSDMSREESAKPGEQVFGVDADEERKPRTREEMAAESAELRPLFAKFSLPFEDDS